MQRTLFLSVALQMCVGLSGSAQTQWQVDSSQVIFYIKNAGFTVEGTFDGLSADIRFDPRSISSSSITASIPASTIDTDIQRRDKHLRGPDYFDVEQYPLIKMSSMDVVADGNDYRGIFRLELKGVPQEIPMTFSFLESDDIAEFEGTFEINRTEFGVGKKNFILSSDVRVDIWVRASKAASN